MSTIIRENGLPISRAQLKKICEIIGYDPCDVRSVQFRGAGPVVVEVFLRLPVQGSKRGVRFTDPPGGEYARAQIVHPVRLAPENSDDSEDN